MSPVVLMAAGDGFYGFNGSIKAVKEASPAVWPPAPPFPTLGAPSWVPGAHGTQDGGVPVWVGLGPPASSGSGTCRCGSAARNPVANGATNSQMIGVSGRVWWQKEGKEGKMEPPAPVSADPTAQ